MKLEARHVGQGKYSVSLRGEDGQPKHSDELRPTVEKDRARFLNQVRELLPAADLEHIRQELLKVADRQPPAGPDRDSGPAPAPEDKPEDRAAAIEVLRSKDLMGTVREDLAACGLATDLDLALVVYLAFTSRLLEDPVSIFMQGPSSSGKTYIGKVVGRLMPPEKMFDVQGLTPKVLFYMGTRTKHAVVQMGEWSRDDDQGENGTKTAAMRQLMSDGRLSQLYVNTETGKPAAERSDTEGPVAVYATSTLPMARIFEEDENRFLFLHPDETEAATRKVMDRKADEAAGIVRSGTDHEEGILRLHHAMQRELGREPAAVVVPFARRLGRLFPSDQPRRRRDFGKLLALVKACALLHRQQRRHDGQGRIIADARDYEMIHGLMSRYMVRPGPTPAELRKCAMLREKFKAGDFRRRDAERTWNVRKAQAAESIRALMEANLLENSNGAKGVYRLTDVHAPLERPTLLPDVAAVAALGEGLGDGSDEPDGSWDDAAADFEAQQETSGYNE